jgi:hypothetical protein
MVCATAGHDLSGRSQLRAHIEVFWHTCTAHLPVMYQATGGRAADEAIDTLTSLIPHGIAAPGC